MRILFMVLTLLWASIASAQQPRCILYCNPYGQCTCAPVRGPMPGYPRPLPYPPYWPR